MLETDPVYFGAAKPTGACIYAVFRDAETIPLDDGFLALVTVCMFGLKTRDVPRVYITQACLYAYLACPYQSFWRCGGRIGKFVGRVEGAHMPGGFRSCFIPDESGYGLELLIRVVMIRDNERCYLNPDAQRLVILDRFEHPLYARAAYLSVKVIGNALQVDVGSIEIGLYRGKRFLLYIPISNEVVGKTPLFGEPGYVVGILVEHGRLGVRVRYAATSCLLCVLHHVGG